MADPRTEKFPKWLYRECCGAIVEVPKRFKDLEYFACKCGKKVPGEKIKTYYDTREAAEKVKAQKSGMDGMPDLGELAGM